MSDERCALVLEGGAMRGMYTAGVLDCFMDHDISFDAVIGVFQIVSHHFSHCCFLWAVFSSCHKNNLQTE